MNYIKYPARPPAPPAGIYFVSPPKTLNFTLPTHTMKTIEVVAAIIRKGDKIFATQRGYGDFKDWWEFPGGKLPLEK